ncbi:UNKNOWN [Stylonychia lemnae]|uniref:HMG box domain-containing protein n=1 Tax=Stylonychia lemnae TaxID=5949 RepID=A0A078B6A0_STYLE|nr:UNKNOWN [Stylonychia lemnae]|eukprot:CDW89073.1 UNKNOWN [Stylonychia lemnae]
MKVEVAMTMIANQKEARGLNQQGGKEERIVPNELQELLKISQTERKENFQDNMRQLGQKWQSMTEEEKQKYKDQI